jgi:hypothetical protein
MIVGSYMRLAHTHPHDHEIPGTEWPVCPIHAESTLWKGDNPDPA